MQARDANRPFSWLCLLVGAAAFTFVGWRFNVALAAWIAPVLLVRFFRHRERWRTTLAAIPALAVASFVQLNGGWDLDAWMVPVFSLLRPAPLLVALYADRALRRRLPVAAATLVFPAVFLFGDWLIALTPLGSGMAASATQFGLPAVAQLASVTGIWGIGFLAAWVASVVNTLWEHRDSFAQVRRLAVVAGFVLVGVLAFGAFRVSLARPASPTVRVGSFTVSHPRDYWDWIDRATPRDVVASHAAELSGIVDELFSRSERAVTAGAKIVFWSEGNGVIPEDRESAFMDRAAAFAQGNGVYFAPAVVVLRYGTALSDNKVVMFAPDGSRVLAYVKTMSWYPTGSDGVLRTVDTP